MLAWIQVLFFIMRFWRIIIGKAIFTIISQYSRSPAGRTDRKAKTTTDGVTGAALL
jgi:uncharacterized membrane protein YedE/YeeE